MIDSRVSQDQRAIWRSLGFSRKQIRRMKRMVRADRKAR